MVNQGHFLRHPGFSQPLFVEKIVEAHSLPITTGKYAKKLFYRAIAASSAVAAAAKGDAAKVGQTGQVQGSTSPKPGLQASTRKTAIAPDSLALRCRSPGNLALQSDWGISIVLSGRIFFSATTRHFVSG